MSYNPFAGRRAMIASAAVLALALLSGCQSSSGNGDGAKNAQGLDVAGTSSQEPAGDPAQTLEAKLTQVGDRVHFELDRYDLTPEAEATLQKQAALLKSFQSVAITIEGHADERGTREYNLALGERRADTVRNYLVALGVPTDRVSVISYGKERPECAEAAETCWAQNRRGVTVASR
jgi:peptidoglycan-associated lipoprotein